MTRTPDVHFVAEARNNGSKMVVLSPDFSEVAQVCRRWMPIQCRHGGGLLDGRQPRHPARNFTRHGKSRISWIISRDIPTVRFWWNSDKSEKGYTAGRFLRADALRDIEASENGDWKFLVFDAKDGRAAHAPRRRRIAAGRRRKGQMEPANSKTIWTARRSTRFSAFLKAAMPNSLDRIDGFRQQPDVPARRSSEVRRDG